MGNAELFSLEGVGKSFKRKVILDNVHLKINRGEFVFITGPVAAGKTTLLKILGKLLKIDAGKLNIQRCHVTHIFQDLCLLNNWSVKDNLLVSKNKDLYPNNQLFWEKAYELFHYFDLSVDLETNVGVLSGGQKQKVAIVRAFLSGADVILADEPTSALEASGREKLYNLFHNFWKNNHGTIVWATHNSDLVKRYNHRMIHLLDGKPVYTGNACFI